MESVQTYSVALDMHDDALLASHCKRDTHSTYQTPYSLIV